MLKSIFAAIAIFIASIFGGHQVAAPSQPAAAAVAVVSNNTTSVSSPTSTGSTPSTAAPVTPSFSPMQESATKAAVHRAPVEQTVAQGIVLGTTTDTSSLSLAQLQTQIAGLQVQINQLLSAQHPSYLSGAPAVQTFLGNTIPSILTLPLSASDIPTNITASNYLPLSGATLTGALSSTASATSTFANGFDISGGCFAVNGTCITGGGGGSLTGTTGQVAYFSGTNTAVGTSSLFIDTNGNVGIGTTNSGSSRLAIAAPSAQTGSGTISCGESFCNVWTGSGTQFTTQVAVGDVLVIAGASYLVTQIDSDTQLQTDKYTNTTLTNEAYTFQKPYVALDNSGNNGLITATGDAKLRTLTLGDGAVRNDNLFGNQIDSSLLLSKTYTDFFNYDFNEGITITNVLDRNTSDSYVASYYGIDVEPYTKPGSTANYDEINGAAFIPSHQGTGTVNDMEGVIGAAQLASAGRINKLGGGIFVVENVGTGIVDVMKSVDARLGARSGSTVDNMYGYYLGGFNIEKGGAVGNAYGLYMEDLSVFNATSTTYGLYIKGPTVKNYIAGDVGIGTTTPWRTLSITGTVGFDGLTGATGAGSLCLSVNKEVVYNSGSDNCLSSLRSTKHDINDLTLSGTSTVAALVPVSFIYNNDASSTVRYGFIAEDTAAVDAHLGTYDQSGKLSGVDDRSILSILVKALQELIGTVQGFAQSITSAVGNFDQVNTNQFCVNDPSGKTCISRAQLDAILAGTGQSPSNPVQIGGGDFIIASTTDSTSEGTTTPEVVSDTASSTPPTSPPTDASTSAATSTTQ